MSRNRRGGKAKVRKTEINMVPFLDVLLTVLLIFMIATPTVNSSIDVKVPNSAVAKVTDDINQKDILVVEVHSDGTYTMLFNVDKYTSLDRDQLIKQLNRSLEGKSTGDTIVQVAADKAAVYDSVVKALDILKGYGFKDVGLITGGTSPSDSNLPTNLDAQLPE